MNSPAESSIDLYVQITATPKKPGSLKTVIVFVPRKNIARSREDTHTADSRTIARNLADPIARNVFTHRATFGPFQLAYLFFDAPPPEIVGQPPEFVQGDLKAWII